MTTGDNGGDYIYIYFFLDYIFGSSCIPIIPLFQGDASCFQGSDLRSRLPLIVKVLARRWKLFCRFAVSSKQAMEEGTLQYSLYELCIV